MVSVDPTCLEDETCTARLGLPFGDRSERSRLGYRPRPNGTPTIATARPETNCTASLVVISTNTDVMLVQCRRRDFDEYDKAISHALSILSALLWNSDDRLSLPKKGGE
jgi:hypothetical protein